MEIDRIHFYVADANRTRDLLIRQLGLELLGEQIDEQTIEYLVGNTHLLFAISAPLNSASPVAKYLQRHPSGVKDISFRVADLDEIALRVSQLGLEIVETSPVGAKLPWLKIRGWGDVDHTIRQSSPAVALSEIDSPSETLRERADRITGIDHLVLNVGVGELAPATIWYQDLFDFRVQQTFDIQTQTSGLTSKALVSPCGKVRFNINEPSSGNSQIQDFIDLNQGAGIQHIALQTQAILPTVERMQQQQLGFLAIDSTYYTQLQLRAKTTTNLALTDRELQQVQNLQILADWSEADPEAVLLQIFTQPIFETPTFFFEIIERRNRAKGFGQGNFQALFEAIEQNLAA